MTAVAEATPLQLSSSRTSFEISYDAHLVSTNEQMSVRQKVEASNGVELFQQPGRRVKLTRDGPDQPLQPLEDKLLNFAPDLTCQYINVKSVYDFVESPNGKETHEFEFGNKMTYESNAGTFLDDNYQPPRGPVNIEFN